MIFLDTNAVYYLSGMSTANSGINISTLEKEITDGKEYCISSLSVFEILNHFRDDIESIRKVFSYLKRRNISIVHNKYLPLRKFTTSKLSRLRTMELNRFLKVEFKNKIKLETTYTTALLVGVYSTYTVLYCKEKWDCDFGNVAKFVYSTSLSLVFKYVWDAVEDTIQKGYISENCETELRRTFYELLGNIIIKTLPTIKDSMGNTQKLDWVQITSDMEKLKKQISRKDSSVDYVCKKIKAEETKNPDFMQDMTNDFLKMISSLNIPQFLNSFLSDKFKAIVTTGEAFRKNDIVDRMLLDELGVEDAIVTFDKKFCEYISKNMMKSTNLKNSYIEINKYMKI